MRAYLTRIRSSDYVNLLFHDFFINTIKNNNKVVDIDLFMFNDLAKWSVLNEGKTMDAQVALELSKADEYRIEKNNQLTVYSRFEPILDEGLFSQRFATKVTYDISELRGLSTRIAFFSIVVLLAVAPIAFLIVSFATNNKIIAPIQEITRGLNRISKGEYGVPLKSRGDNEIIQIGQAINEMQGEILDREQKLVKHHAILEELVEERTSDLREEVVERKQAEKAMLEAKEIAEEATREKDKYVSMIAHDLKAPFASIIGFLEIVESSRGSRFIREDKSLLKKIVASATGAVNTIDEILHFSRFQSGGFHIKPRFFDGYMAVLTVVANYGHIASEKGIEVVNNVHEGTRLYADPTLFTEVLQNLITNAIKFSSKGDLIEFFTPTNETTVIALKDTGVGIDKQLLPDIFLSASKTTTIGTAGEKGTGLGLPICHGIIEAHDGKLTVESVKGSGSTFFVKLPKVRPLILIADDDQVTRFILKSHLENIGATIIEAKDGAEALKQIESYKPHLILMDIAMPNIDGYEALMRIKRDSDTEHIPVIIITSDNRLESREKIMRLGADDIIKKPFKSEDLIPRVRKFIS
jgi:signal transduction histidine kinase